jgi:hypothetical protein
MLNDWAFAQRGSGVFILSVRGDVIVLEFNEFLGRIADGRIQDEDVVLSRVFTDGRRCRVGSLHVFALVRSGQVRTDDLPRREAGGVLATGEQARALLRQLEAEISPGERKAHPEAEFLLRASTAPMGALESELLRAAEAIPSSTPPEELPRPAGFPQERPEPV